MVVPWTGLTPRSDPNTFDLGPPFSFPEKSWLCVIINVCLCWLWLVKLWVPSGFEVTSDLPMLKGTSLLFLRAAAVTSLFCDYLLSVWLFSGLNVSHTMLHCPQTYDEAVQSRSSWNVGCSRGCLLLLQTLHCVKAVDGKHLLIEQATDLFTKVKQAVKQQEVDVTSCRIF